MRFVLILLLLPQISHAGWLKDFCERHLVGDAEIVYSTELTDLFVKSKGAFEYMERLEERYQSLARELLWKRGQDHVLAHRLRTIGEELRRIDPECPAIERYRVFEESL